MPRRFEMSGTLQKKLAAKLAPQLGRLARELADDAKANAPRDKYWIDKDDNLVRPEHRDVDPVPSNLRFKLRTPEYDRIFYLPNEWQYGPEPKAVDWSGINGFTSGLTVECRCFPYISSESMLADKIEVHLTAATGDRIRATITCDHTKAEDAEFGNSIDKGARFLGRALQKTARKLGVRRIASR